MENNTDGPQFMMVQLNYFLTLQSCKNPMHSVEIVLWILIFSQERDVVWYSLMLLLPVSHTVTKVSNQHHYLHSVPIQPFCFSLSVQYSITYMSYSTLYYKIGSVLDENAQPEANVNVLSTFKVGLAKLGCSIDQVY